MNDSDIASAKVVNLTCSIPEHVIYKPTSICNTSPRYAMVSTASAITNLACSTQCSRLATFQPLSNKNPDPGSVDNVEWSTVYVDEESLPLAYDTTSEYMGFNHLAHIKMWENHWRRSLPGYATGEF